MHSAKNIVKEETCFKSIENPSCIDLLLTNKPNLFFNTSTINTGLSDCHKMVVAVLRKTFQRAQPKVFSYRDYKNFDNELFKSSLQNALNTISRPDYIKFEEAFLEKLNMHVRLNRKHALYMTKGFRKAIMRRSELEIKYHKHRDIQSLRQYKKQNVSDIFKENSSLNSKKQGTKDGISTKCLKTACSERSSYLTEVWNEEMLTKNSFPQNLKLADVILVFKKCDPTCAKNYRPISVLPTVSKVFERLMHDQITRYMDAHLSKHLCAYRKGFNTQTALLSLIEKWKSILDKKGFSGAVLMKLLKAFDTINHELLIVKLDAYGFSKKSLELILDYLSNRLQHVKINSTFSSWSEITQVVPQGSVLGPPLFNIYLNDLFFLLDDIDICNFADDTTPNICDMELKVVLGKLENCRELAIAWFKSNYMKLNEEKCELLVCGYRFGQLWIKIGDNKTWEKLLVKFLGVTIDNELKFDKYIAEICAKANRKLSVLPRLSKFLCLDK